MRNELSLADQAELLELRKLSALIGSDLCFTQASSGNSSIKLKGDLWIKASGLWMADALKDDVLIPLRLSEVRYCLDHQMDPAEKCTGASIETAMHAVLPHRVVLHLHCVNTIAWAVRKDAPEQLAMRLDGLNWRWIPYVPSGLPLAGEIENATSPANNTNIFVLGNHGLVLCADTCAAVSDLLSQVELRLKISPRVPTPTNLTALKELTGSSWKLPEDPEVHALGTDPVSRAILSGGLLFPGQSFCSNSNAAELFCPVSDTRASETREQRSRPFLIIENLGVLVSKNTTCTQLAMMSGLAKVIQRISPTAPLRYLSEEEVASSYGIANAQYREIANACRNGAR